MKKLISFILSAIIVISVFSAIPFGVYASEDENMTSIGTAEKKTSDTEELENDNEAVMHYIPCSDTKSNTFTKRLLASASQTCGTNLNWSLSGGVLTISGSGSMTDYDFGDSPWYSSADQINSVVIGNGVTTIGKCAFYGLTNLTSVTVANTVKTINEAAFYQCTSLSTVSLPNSVTTLNTAVFADCTKLSSFSASGLVSIGDFAFQDTAITAFQIPKGLTSISSSAFIDSDIESFTVESGNTKFSALNGVVYTDNSKTLCFYPMANTATAFAVPSTVTKISDRAFAYCKNLESVSIPDSVITIGLMAFYNCSSLISITIPDSVTSVNDYAFGNCWDLESVKLGNGLNKTSYEMFEYCYSLTTVDFGSSIEELDALTFVHCTSLKSITLPENIKTISNAVFGYCYALKSFTSYGLTDIPFQTFFGCSSLSEVNLNEGITTIYRSSFYKCTSLENITLPESVTFVHSLAFPKETIVNCKNSELRRYGVNGYRYLQDVNINSDQYYNYAFEVLELVNKERANAGLNPLVMNESLLDTAMIRAGESAILFSHTRPDSSSAFSLNDLMVAENVAVGQTTPEQAMTSWMNSEGHKANILREEATTIGIGCVKHNGIYYWVQCFGTGSDESSCTQPENCTVKQTVSLATETFGEAEIGYGAIWTDEDVEYSYAPYVKLSSSKLNIGDSATAKVYITNPGWQSVSAVLNNTSLITWSSDSSAATVSSAGSVTAVKGGTANIKASLKYFSSSAKITVTCADSAHKYVSTTTKATTSKNGKTTYKCSVCGATKAAKTIYYPKTITLSSSSYTYDGKVKKPSVTVKGSDGKKIAASNYTVTYSSGRKNVGKYTVTIKFKGNYSGTVKKTFTIKPKNTSISKVTAKSKGFTVKWKKYTTQTTGYQIQYSTSSKFTSGTTKTVTVSKNSTTSKTVSKLKSKKKYYVRIRTYKTVSGTKYYSSWSKAKTVTTKK